MTQLMHVNFGRISGAYKKHPGEILYKILLAIFPHWMCKANTTCPTLLAIAW